MGGLPPQQFAGPRARGWAVEGEEAGQPGEVRARVLRRDGSDRHVEMAPDQLGDLADRHALVGDRVQRRPRRSVLQASRKRGAASSRGTAGQRLDPSPM